MIVTRIAPLLRGAALVLLAALSVSVLVGQASEAPPNVVFILSDDQGYADVGYRGSGIRTPHIDALAAEGVKLEQFYVQPVCTPTRAAFMSGLYPMRLGLQLGVIKPGSRHGLPLHVRTLPQALKEVGYFTAITGKWHLGNEEPEYLPTRRGFDHQHGLYLGMGDYFTHERDGGLDWHRNDRALHQPGYATELIGSEAVGVIERQDEARPFFLYVAFSAPHTPLQTPDSYLAMYSDIEDKKRRTYAAMLTAMDDAVGKIVRALEGKGWRERTLVVFCSDNGGNLPAASNHPLRDQKGSVYEGGVRVPAFATWPGVLPKGTVVRQPLHIVDWHATILKLAGASAPSGVTLDGGDLLPALKGDPKPIHEEILVNAAPGTGALRRGRWKLVINGHLHYKGESPGPDFSWAELLRVSGAAPGDAARRQIELFNLDDDPGETRDVAALHPEIVHELTGRYEAYARQAVPLLDGTVPDGQKTPAVWGER